MNRAKLTRLAVRLANSLSSTQQQGFLLHRLNQVTHFSQFHHKFSIFKNPDSSCISPISQKTFSFSSNPDSFIQSILSNDWSNEFENELENIDPKVTHEFVVYVLKKLNGNPQKSLDFFVWACHKKGFNPSYLPYTLLLRSLACKGFVNEFSDFALEMKEKGIHFDNRFYIVVKLLLKREKLDKTLEEWNDFYKSVSKNRGKNDVANNVAEVIMGADWSEEVESKLKRLNFDLSDNELFLLIWSLKDEPLKALKFFEWVVDHKCEHNSVMFSGIAKVLARGGLMDEFWKLVTRGRSEGYEIDSYATVSRFLKNEDAVSLFEFMMDGPYKLLEPDCIWLLKNLAHDVDPDIELVNRVVNKYVEAGNNRTKAVYDGIHRCLCKVGRFDEAKKIVEDMKNAGYKPDNITFSQEVFGLCKVRRFEDASQVLDTMKSEGCVPDIQTWTMLMQGYCAAGQVDNALSCFKQMLEKKIEPDAAVLEVLLNGFISNNKFGASEFLVEMVNETGVTPWQATYKSMIDKLVEDGELEKAFNLLHMMKEHGYPPYAKSIVDSIAKSGTVEDAKKLLGALSLKGHSPSVSAYVNVISSFFEEGRFNEAKDLLFDSPAKVRNQKKIKSMFGSSKYLTEKKETAIHVEW